LAAPNSYPRPSAPPLVFSRAIPPARAYAGFADFHFYRVIIERGHLVTGFGKIAWIEAQDLRFAADTAALERPNRTLLAT